MQRYDMKNSEYHLETEYAGIMTSGKLKTYISNINETNDSNKTNPH